MSTTVAGTPVIRVFDDRPSMGRAAAADVAAELRRRLAAQPGVRMVFAAAPSQREMLDHLVAAEGVDWTRVTAFHMDEYLGLPQHAPERFAEWLRAALFDRLPFAAVHTIDPGDDPEATAASYADLLAEAPIDIVCCGIGQNGHLAFNDPPVADLADPLDVKIVELDEVCRRQQVDDECFARLEDVPRRALTLTIPRLLRADRIFCVVPGASKRDAVVAALTAPISAAHPATALRTHPDVTVYVDAAAAPPAGVVAADSVATASTGTGAAVDATFDAYLGQITGYLGRILVEEASQIRAAAALLADQIAADRLVHVYGPGGHSNLAAQEVFFRAGGLVHIAAILDEGTLLSGGALRSMAMERTPGYGRVVIEDRDLGEGDLLVLVNAYGINAALIDAALTARGRGVRLVGISSRSHAEQTAPDHPARHPSGANLHDLVDVAIDSKVPVGDAVMELPGVGERVAAVSTFANAYVLNCLTLATVEALVARGIEPPVWRSGNAPGGDAANARFLDRFRGRVRWL